MSNTYTTKIPGWAQVLAKHKQFQILIRNPTFIITITIHGKKFADTKGIINQTLYIKEGQAIQWLKETWGTDQQWTTKKQKQRQEKPTNITIEQHVIGNYQLPRPYNKDNA